MTLVITIQTEGGFSTDPKALDAHGRDNDRESSAYSTEPQASIRQMVRSINGTQRCNEKISRQIKEIARRSSTGIRVTMNVSLLIFYVMAFFAVSYAGNLPGKQNNENLEETHCLHLKKHISAKDCDKGCLKLSREVAKLSTQFKITSGFCKKKCRCVVETYYEPINQTLTLSKSLEKLEKNHYKASLKDSKKEEIDPNAGTYRLLENSIDD